MVNHSIHHSTDGCCMLVMIRPISERTTPLQKETRALDLIGRDVSDEREGVSDSEKREENVVTPNKNTVYNYLKIIL